MANQREIKSRTDRALPYLYKYQIMIKFSLYSFLTRNFSNSKKKNPVERSWVRGLVSVWRHQTAVFVPINLQQNENSLPSPGTLDQDNQILPLLWCPGLSLVEEIIVHCPQPATGLWLAESHCTVQYNAVEIHLTRPFSLHWTLDLETMTTSRTEPVTNHHLTVSVLGLLTSDRIGGTKDKGLVLDNEWVGWIGKWNTTWIEKCRTKAWMEVRVKKTKPLLSSLARLQWIMDCDWDGWWQEKMTRIRISIESDHHSHSTTDHSPPSIPPVRRRRWRC